MAASEKIVNNQGPAAMTAAWPEAFTTDDSVSCRLNVRSANPIPAIALASPLGGKWLGGCRRE